MAPVSFMTEAAVASRECMFGSQRMTCSVCDLVPATLEGAALEGITMYAGMCSEEAARARA